MNYKFNLVTRDIETSVVGWELQLIDEEVVLFCSTKTGLYRVATIASNKPMIRSPIPLESGVVRNKRGEIATYTEEEDKE